MYNLFIYLVLTIYLSNFINAYAVQNLVHLLFPIFIELSMSIDYNVSPKGRTLPLLITFTILHIIDFLAAKTIQICKNRVLIV